MSTVHPLSSSGHPLSSSGHPQWSSQPQAPTPRAPLPPGFPPLGAGCLTPAPSVSLDVPLHTEGLIPKEGRTVPPGAHPLPQGLASALRLAALALQAGQRLLQRPAPHPRRGPGCAPSSHPGPAAASGSSWGRQTQAVLGAQPRYAPEDAAPGICLDHVQGRRVKKQELSSTVGTPHSFRSRACWPGAGKGTSPLWSERPRKTSLSSLPRSWPLE